MDLLIDLLAAWQRWSDGRRRDPSRAQSLQPASPEVSLDVSEPGEPDGSRASAILKCPEDGHPLAPMPDPFSNVLYCGACSGVFLPRPLDDAVAEEPDRLDALSVPRVAERRSSLPKYRRCPCCNHQMARRNFERVSGIIIDRCPDHGTWFDGGELEAAIHFVRAGGGTRKRAFEEREAAWQSQQRKTIKEWQRDALRRRRPESSLWFNNDE